MFRFLGRVLTIFIGCSLALLGLIIGGAYLVMKLGDLEPKKLPDQTVLFLDLTQETLHETPPSAFENLTLGNAISLREAITSIEKAKDDDRVVALVTRLYPNAMGIGQVQELREAVIEFSKQKPSYVFAESFGDIDSGNLDYYLASGFKEIWLQPSGSLAIAGMSVESPFVKGTLDLLGIQTEFFQRHEFKGATEMFTNTEFSEPVRSSLSSLLNSYYRQMVDGISQQRNLSSDDVEKAIQRAPLLAQEAKEFGLIDQVNYWDIMVDMVSPSINIEDYVSLIDYYDRTQFDQKFKTTDAKIALIYAVGEIISGESQGQTLTGSLSIEESIDEVLADDQYKAVVVRVDSPGGSYTASDTIWRDLFRAKEAGLPVYISMGNYAASGGYFIALPGTKIYADPGTLTGSIGIFYGKFVLRDLFTKLGISWDTVEVGPSTALWSAVRPLDERLRERLNAFLDFAYADFTGKVAKARSFDGSKIDEVARGRIFTGKDAKDLGLVDELGGLNAALKEAEAKIKADNPNWVVAIDTFPSPQSPTDELLSLLGASSQEFMRIKRILSPFLTEIEPISKAIPQSNGQDRLMYYPKGN